MMHDRTGGNPFFLRQLARLLTESQPATAEDAFVPLPAGVRHVISSRLHALSERAVRPRPTSGLESREHAPDNVLSELRMKDEMDKALGKVGERERQIPEMRFGLNGSERMTLEMVGKKLKQPISPNAPEALPLYVLPMDCAQSSITLRLCFFASAIRASISQG